MRRDKPQAVGAKRKLESVTRTAESRRAHREAKGQPLVQAKTPAALDAEARALLRDHKVRESPASIRLAKLHCQSMDAVDALYEICVSRGKEPRLVSAMVSAGKLAVTTLERLGLPGELDDDFDLYRTHASPQSEVDPLRPDELSAWE